MAEGEICLPEHAYYCFDVLQAHLTNSPLPSPPFPDAKYPLFVTWNVRSSKPGGHSKLRGCIGNFGDQDLGKGLAEYALISALEDHRFNPIQEKELPKLECSVSLLTDFEDASNYLDWTIGVHGIYISFENPYIRDSSFRNVFSRRRTYSRNTMTATYLPEVIPEQGWDKVEAIEGAMRKAGWDGDIDEQLRQSVRLRRYRSRKITVSWGEYQAWKESQITSTTSGTDTPNQSE
ncbi:uncharacterized protein EI90DRAFT_2977081 [Cantharellus anzutake]|uniref:uncharacterized protein n=1 Tax=Cantharellus anzutake TaxID=1750568 RepID=UPI0019073BB4|nr:uncharacterized protein EI90DRAFT_2977081 [Cantharellus anzutake]KAF8324446.1 hypothetical protein EI90DRAFT_2977081 [Cantharellus anzutake]